MGTPSYNLDSLPDDVDFPEMGYKKEGSDAVIEYLRLVSENKFDEALRHNESFFHKYNCDDVRDVFFYEGFAMTGIYKVRDFVNDVKFKREIVRFFRFLRGKTSYRKKRIKSIFA